MSVLKVHEIFRYSRPYSEKNELINGYANYFNRTFTAGCKLPILDRGINPIQEISSISGNRRPAILISSSPHKIGSVDTPWQDIFDTDNGRISYYGDNKTPGVDPSTSSGNKVLLAEFRLHSSSEKDIRALSAPLVFFKRVSQQGKSKGFVEFHGFGIVNKVQLITQFDIKNRQSFSNYRFDFAVFDLSEDLEEFNWDWISDRRNPSIALIKTLRNAPKSWNKWLKSQQNSPEKYKRRVSRLLTIHKIDQIGGTWSGKM